MATSLRMVVEGRQLTDDDPYGVLVGQGVAQALQLRGGDHATLVVNTVERRA